MYKAKTGVGCDSFQPKVPLNLTKEMRGGIVEFLKKVEQSGKCPQQACTMMFLLIPKNVTSERPIALIPTLIRWWEALRAPEVAKWHQKFRVDWDATDGRDGGAWEVLVEMERFNGKAKAEEQGAVVLVLDLAEAFERQPPSGLGLGNTHQLPKEDLTSALRLFRAPEECTVRRMCGRAATNHHGHFARVQVELLAVAHCVAGCIE